MWAGSKSIDIMKRRRILQYVLGIGIIGMCIPLIVCTLYTYPVQDDFFNTWNVGVTMREGHTAFGAAIIKAVRGWSDYSGYYFSLFLTYFSDAVIQCSIWGIRICQFIIAVCFYLSVYLWIRIVVVKVFGIDKENVIPIAFLYFICLTSLYYFVENEDFLWFCASVIYLIPLTFVFVGIICMIYILDTEKYQYIGFPMVIGFLAGGAVLNIAAFGCIAYIMTAYWGIVVRKKIKISIFMCIPMLAGGIINVVAPGNFIRKGGTLTVEEILSTAIGTCYYILNRMKMFLFQYPLFAVVLIALTIIVFRWKPDKLKYKFYVPVLFTFIMFLAVWIVIFPVALGYGMDVYYIMERSNYVSDLVIFSAVFITIFYWRGWIAIKFPNICIGCKYKGISSVFILVLFVIGMVISAKWNRISSLRIYRELLSGDIPAYAQWNVDIIKEIEKAHESAVGGSIIEIYVDKMDDNVCLINPKIQYGYYNPETEFANGSIARFYGVDAVYIHEKQ